MAKSNLPTIILPVKKSNVLEDNKLWKNRFEIHSETSDRVYVVSQNIAKGHMGCSCMGWRRYRTCKHLSALGLPGHEEPVNLKLNVK
jgi:hypothetical protein